MRKNENDKSASIFENRLAFLVDHKKGKKNKKFKRVSYLGTDLQAWRGMVWHCSFPTFVHCNIRLNQFQHIWPFSFKSSLVQKSTANQFTPVSILIFSCSNPNWSKNHGKSVLISFILVLVHILTDPKKHCSSFNIHNCLFKSSKKETRRVKILQKRKFCLTTYRVFLPAEWELVDNPALGRVGAQPCTGFWT